jgi:hypothetical protein
MGGSAMLAAANAFHQEIKKAAAMRFDCRPADIVIADERVSGPRGQSLRLSELAADNLSAEGSFANHHHT